MFASPGSASAGVALPINSNEDAATEEFDSEDLGVEKDVRPHGRASFSVGPLKPGVYSYRGELHSDTAWGQLKAE